MGNIRRELFPIIVAFPERRECIPVQKTSRHQPREPHSRKFRLSIRNLLYILQKFNLFIVLPTLKK